MAQKLQALCNVRVVWETTGIFSDTIAKGDEKANRPPFCLTQPGKHAILCHVSVWNEMSAKGVPLSDAQGNSETGRCSMTDTSSSPLTRFALHFVPLFTVALIVWVAFGMLREGAVYWLPGVIAASVLGGLGTYIALRNSRSSDLRGRDALEGYAMRQMERTMARTGAPLTFRIGRPR